MKKLLSLIVSILVFALSFGVVGCGGNDNSTGGTVLRICNCEDYIDEELLTEFEEETGITVQYSTYGTNENLYNELVINPNSYDLVVPSEYMIQKLATEGRIQKLDQTKLTGYNEKLSGFIKEKLDAIQFTVKDGVDKGQEVSLSEYLVGYMWGTMGWVYNTDNVDASDVKSWHGVFENPDLNKKMTIKDSVRDSYLVGLAMVYEEELRAANTNEKITEILNLKVSELADYVDSLGLDSEALIEKINEFVIEYTTESDFDLNDYLADEEYADKTLGMLISNSDDDSYLEENGVPASGECLAIRNHSSDEADKYSNAFSVLNCILTKGM
jgi:spermidine/putrescine transport system substrate-binding protein